MAGMLSYTIHSGNLNMDAGALLPKGDRCRVKHKNV